MHNATRGGTPETLGKLCSVCSEGRNSIEHWDAAPRPSRMPEIEGWGLGFRLIINHRVRKGWEFIGGRCLEKLREP